MGLRASPTVQLNFDGLRVPGGESARRGGAGFHLRDASLDNGRLGIAAQAIGIARAALEHALDYTAQRQQFGLPIRDFQAIQFKLADMGARIASSRAMLHATAALKDRGESTTLYGSMSKLLASETAMWVTTAGRPDLRRLRLREGLSRRTLLPRREGHGDLRGDFGDSADRDSEGAVRANRRARSARRSSVDGFSVHGRPRDVTMLLVTPLLFLIANENR